MKTGGAQIEQRTEAAEAGCDARTVGGAGKRLDRLDQRRSGVDIDARLFVGEWDNASPRAGMIEFRRRMLTIAPPMCEAIPVMTMIRLWLAALLLLVAAAWTAPATAQAAADNPYEVTGVHVDVTAENAAAARGLALADGARQALMQLVERYVAEDKRGRFAKMSQQQIEDMVNDFSIRDEKTSGVRYIATLDYRFKASRVSRLLAAAGATPPAATSQAAGSTTDVPPPPRPIVVIPILEAGPGQAPGGGADPWRDAWQALAERSDGRYVLASGDTAAIASDQERLSALVRRTGGDSALVAVASVGDAPEGRTQGINVRFHRQSSNRQATGGQTYLPDDGETPQAFFRRVAVATQAEASTAWRQAAASPPAQRARLQLAVPVNDLSDWLQLQKQIRQVNGVSGIDTVLMSRREMLVNLSFSGSVEDLTQRLEDADLTLADNGGRRVLRRDTTPIEPTESEKP